MASNASKKNKRMNLVKDFIRNVPVDDGDFILIKKASDLAESIRVFNALRTAFGAVGKQKVVVAIVDEFDEIKVLGEKEMAEYGWYRKEPTDV